MHVCLVDGGFFLVCIVSLLLWQFALKVIYNMPPLHVFVCKSACTLHFCRCFSFGIGSGASTHLVRGIAEAGRGTAEFVTRGERMQPKVCILIEV